jgi:hypothetical protein
VEHIYGEPDDDREECDECKLSFNVDAAAYNYWATHGGTLFCGSCQEFHLRHDC